MYSFPVVMATALASASSRGEKKKKKKNELSSFRLLLLLLFPIAVALIIDFSLAAGLADPYSSRRRATNLSGPSAIY